MSESRKTLNVSDAKISNGIELSERLTKSANEVVLFLESKLQKDGSYGSDIKDIACYFKSPMLFILSNKQDSAILILQYIKKTFMSSDGDFKTNGILKSKNPAYTEYWTYVNGWIIRAAIYLGEIEISNSANNYLKKYNINDNGAFLTNNIETQSGITDVLTVAHHGLLNLEMNNMQIAIAAGKYLCDALISQPNLTNGFYLRFDKKGNPITTFTDELAPFYFVSNIKPNQLHFMIGYPAAYLAMLYLNTQQHKFINAAKAYLEFSLNSDISVYACNFSHKLAWAASIIYQCTGEEKYLSAIDRITDHFIKNQKNAMWYNDNILDSYDQSAEIACWFLEIVKNINQPIKKLHIDNEGKFSASSEKNKSTMHVKI